MIRCFDAFGVLRLGSGVFGYPPRYALTGYSGNRKMNPTPRCVAVIGRASRGFLLILFCNPQFLPRFVDKAVVDDIGDGHGFGYLRALAGEIDEDLDGFRFDVGVFG